MSFPQSKYVYPHSKSGSAFSGGLVTNTPNTYLNPEFSPYLRNARLDGASIINRPGHRSVATLSGTDYPRGLFSYLRADSTNDRLIARQNVDSTHKLVSVTESGVQTSVLTNSDITVDTRMISVNIGDDLHLMNGTDFGKLNGTTYTAIASTKSVNLNTISFTATGTISDSAGGFLGRGYAPGQSITITGSASNNATFTILTVTATTITVAAGVSNEAAGASVTMTTNAAKPSFGVFFAGCQWIGGFTGTGFTNQVWKSPSNTPTGFTASGSDVFTFPENVIGMATTSQAIFVFTKNTVHVADIGSQVQTAGVITFSFRTLQATEGSTNHASIITVGGDVYYISPSNSINKIIRGTSIYGFEVIALSQRKYKGINNIADLLTLNQTEVHSQSFPQQNLIKWFFQSVGNSFCDYCIVYDIVKDMFLIDTNKFFYDECFFHGYVYAVSNITPTIYIDEYGYSDDGGSIDFEYWTKAFDEGEYTMKKGYWESRTDVDLSQLASLTQEIYIDSSVDNQGQFVGTLIDSKTVDSDNIDPLNGGIGTLPVGTFPIGSEYEYTPTLSPVTILRTKGDLNRRGYSIQYRYTNNAIGSQVRLKRVGYKVEILPSITTNLTI